MLGSWLGQLQGGVHPVLLGRSGYFRNAGTALASQGTAFTACCCDVSATGEAAAALSTDTISQLTCILHAGGVLKDATLLWQSAASVRTVFAPKLGFVARASAALHLQTVHAVNMFSSVSAFMGSHGQGNYAAANFALNAWAASIQQQGVAGMWWHLGGKEAECRVLNAVLCPAPSCARYAGVGMTICLDFPLCCRQQHTMGSMEYRGHGAQL